MRRVFQLIGNRNAILNPESGCRLNFKFGIWNIFKRLQEQRAIAVTERTISKHRVKSQKTMSNRRP
jgi:hypothetical protein